MLQLYLWHDFYNLIFKTEHKLCTASGPVPPSANETFWVRNCLFLIQYGFQKGPCNLLWLSQAFCELCSVLCVGIWANFVVREINTGGFIWISEGAPEVQAPKVVGGWPAEPCQFPFMAAIIINNSGFCTGVLISTTWVLTAAHCGNAGSVWTVMWQRPSRFILKSRVSKST